MYAAGFSNNSGLNSWLEKSVVLHAVSTAGPVGACTGSVLSHSQLMVALRSLPTARYRPRPHLTLRCLVKPWPGAWGRVVCELKGGTYGCVAVSYSQSERVQGEALRPVVSGLLLLLLGYTASRVGSVIWESHARCSATSGCRAWQRQAVVGYH